MATKRSYTETEKIGTMTPESRVRAGGNPPEAYRWRPGQSGNPGGKAKKDRELTAALEEIVDKKRLAKKLWSMGLGGDLAAIKYIYDRIEGSPTQRHELDLDEVRRDAQRLAEELGIDPDAVLSEAEAIIRSGH